MPFDAGSSTSAFGGAESIYLQVSTFGVGCSELRLALVNFYYSNFHLLSESSRPFVLWKLKNLRFLPNGCRVFDHEKDTLNKEIGEYWRTLYLG